MKSLLERFSLWLIALVLITAIAVFFRLSSQTDPGNLLKVQVGIKELQSMDLSINLDVLRSKERSKANDEKLRAADQQVHQILLLLGAEFGAVGLEQTLNPVRAAWEKKRGDLEKFWWYRQLLDDAQSRFASHVQHLSGGGARSRIDTLNNRLLSFMAQGGHRDADKLSRYLDNAASEVEDWLPGQRAIGRSLIDHGRVILANQRQTSVLTDEILASSFPAALDAAYATYNTEFLNTSERTEEYRRGMAGFALLLIIVVLLALTRLRESSRQLARSRQLIDNVTDTLGEGIIALDPLGRLAFINRRGQELLGRPKQALLGQFAAQVLFSGSDDGRAFLEAAARGAPASGEAWLATPDGGRFPAAFIGAPLVAENGYVASFRDLSEMHHAQIRLHLAAHIFDSLSEAMLVTDAQGRIQSVNPAFTAITGFSEEEARGRQPGQLLASGRHSPAFFKELWDILVRKGQWQGEIVNRRKNGEIYTEWLSISAVRDSSGGIIQYVGLFTDITERKETEAYIYRLAYHDPLTGLPNRLLFADRLENALLQAHRNQRLLAVLVLDLDRFKVINDTLGHPVGDALLKETARRLEAILREGDTLARQGGDEFAVLMPEIRSVVDAEEYAETLLQSLTRPIALDGKDIVVTTSVGIALYPFHGDSANLLLKSADIALYSAKSAGRNAFRFFDPLGNDANSNRLELEIGLRQALARRQMLLLYQLQVQAATGRVSGVEALVRWQHPEHGLMLPDRFIPLAEDTGLIEEIGAWCLETGCAQFARWQAAGLEVPRLAVNVSARQLRAVDFSRRLASILSRTGMDPHCLEIELTESMLTENTEHTFALFSELRRWGIRIAIDDFGTGYSSLNYLAQYPIDVIKIDRSFVLQIDDDGEVPHVLRTVIELARGLKMETIAEGVETEGQRRRLRELGCDLLQGYLFAPASSAENLPALVERQNARASSPVVRLPSKKLA